MATDPFALAAPTPPVAATPTTDPFAAAHQLRNHRLKQLRTLSRLPHTDSNRNAPAQIHLRMRLASPRAISPKRRATSRRKIWQTLLPEGSLAARVLTPGANKNAPEAAARFNVAENQERSKHALNGWDFKPDGKHSCNLGRGFRVRTKKERAFDSGESRRRLYRLRKAGCQSHGLDEFALEFGNHGCNRRVRQR